MAVVRKRRASSKATPEKIAGDLKTRFYDEINERLDELGMTKTDLAVALEVSPTRAAQILQGGNPTVESIARIGHALGLRFSLEVDEL